MLTLGKLAPGQQKYYLDTVVHGIEEYYVGPSEDSGEGSSEGVGEAPGVWVGAASPLLGLHGRVTSEDLASVLDGVHPSGGWRLTRAQGPARVPGFDATFSAPKSVSVLFALGAPDVAAVVRDAHDAAVGSALSVLEAQASVARRGHGGVAQVLGDGFVAAAFRHRTSRAGDPHLHTHVLVANLVHVPAEDRWSALDARPLYRWLKPAGHVYQAELRAEMTRRLGVAWGPVAKGVAEIEGIPKPLLREFSTRRRQIEARLGERQESGGRAAQIATYATRPGKLPTNMIDLRPLWRQVALDHGLDSAAIAKVVHPERRHEPALPDTRELFEALAGPDGLTAHASHFGRREVVEAVASAMPEGASASQVMGLADAFLESGLAIQLTAPTPSAVEDDRDEVDLVASTRPRDDRTRWTTPSMIEAERRLVDLAVSGRHLGRGVTAAPSVAAALGAQPELAAEQRAMVQAIGESGNAVDVVEGTAGAGKTVALAAAYDAWTSTGHTVIGAALSARAAQQLEEGSGIPSSTLDRLLADLTRPNHPGLAPGTVIVVDEAAMVGTRKLLALLEHAEAGQAKVVLVGDPRQLPEIDAGGAFAGLAPRLDPVVLTENRRQHEPWERNALTELRIGDPHLALDAYLDHDRVHTAADPDTAKADLVDHWATHANTGEQALMLAARLTDVDDLNQLARERLQAAGRLGPDEATFAGRPFAVCDQVLALRNDYRIGVLNGTRATLDTIDTEHGELGLVTDDGRRIEVPTGYAEAGLLTHAYAVTIHKAQGITVDHALVLADDTLPREHAYTAMSRGSSTNEIYVAATEQRSDDAHLPEINTDPLDGLRTALHHSVAETMSIDYDPRSELERLRTAGERPLVEDLTEIRRLLDIVTNVPAPERGHEPPGLELEL